MEKILFSEEQRRNQWWLWLIMLLAACAATVHFIYGIYLQEVLNEPFGNEPISTAGLIASGSFSLIVFGFVFMMVFGSKLKTKVTTEALWISYLPLFRKWKKIARENIEKYEIRTYRSIKEFGGYGMKRRRRNGMSYTMYGNTGLQISFKNGKKLLIGTQKKHAFEFAMAKLMEEKNSG